MKDIRTRPYPICTCRNKNVCEKKCKVNRTLRKNWQNNLSEITPLHWKESLRSGYLWLIFSLLMLRVSFCVVSCSQWRQQVFPVLSGWCASCIQGGIVFPAEGSITCHCFRYHRIIEYPEILAATPQGKSSFPSKLVLPRSCIT